MHTLKDMMSPPPDMGAMPPAGPGAPAPGAGAVNPQVKGILGKLAHANGGEGVESAAETIFAIVAKVLEFGIPVYGVNSEKGKELMKAINSLNKLSGGKQTSGDIKSMISSLISILPSDMQKVNPTNLADILQKGNGAGAPPPSKLPNPATAGNPMAMLGI